MAEIEEKKALIGFMDMNLYKSSAHKATQSNMYYTPADTDTWTHIHRHTHTHSHIHAHIYIQSLKFQEFYTFMD